MDTYFANDKREYISLCILYNRALANCENDPLTFLGLSVKLHAMKGRVPKKMRTEKFVANCGK